MSDLAQSIVWQPQEGPQTALIACPVFEVFFGGARGGGKTEASIGDWLDHSARYGEAAIGLFFRRKLIQLTEVIARTKQLFPKLGGTYNEQRKEWLMRNGARLKFAYLENDTDAEEYQGHSYTRLYGEEITNFPSPDPISKLKATLRSATGVPVGCRFTGNPGGPGHNWVKARYITPNPTGYQVFTETEVFELDGKRITIKLDRVFIPSKILDNKMLMRHDPGYLLRLKQSGSAALVKAWLEGNWDIVDGAFFSEWDEARHILPHHYQLQIPRHALKFRSFDWGSAKPFSVGWYAVSDGTWGLPEKALVKYREWYGAKAPNVGIKLNPVQVSEGIVARETHGGLRERIRYAVADPSIFIRNGGPSIAETMAIHQCQWRKADNKRIPGWEQMRVRLQGEFDVPMLYFLESCEDSIRTIPTLQHEAKDPEDLDTKAEDHAADEVRYAVMSRPWLPVGELQKRKAARGITQLSINELIALKTKQRRAAEANA